MTTVATAVGAASAGPVTPLSSVELDLSIKRFFFDRSIVRASIDAASHRGLNRAGAYLRRVARNSIKKKGAARPAPKNKNGAAYQRWLAERKHRPRSQAGSAPFQHTANTVVSPKNILYGWDGAASVVVGMVGFPRKRGAPLPHEIEFGSSGLVWNERRRIRHVGDGGELRIGGPKSRTTKLALRTKRGDVYVTYGLLRTEAQVARANQINRELYGEAASYAHTAPRPVMRLAFAAAAPKMETAFNARMVGNG